VTKSVTIRAAWISGACVLIAAVVGSVLTWCGPRKKSVSASAVTDSPKVTVSGGQTGNITINYNIPESKTRDAIAALERKIADTNSTIALTRDELHLLAQALKDLDQRTSGIKKLPDGRTQMGDFIAGSPTITIEEHNAAAQAYQRGDYKTALEYSTEAINTYEKSNEGSAIAAGTFLSPEDIAKMYYLGSLSAGATGKLEIALQWSKRADTISPHPEYKAVEVAALSDLGRREEARTLLEQGLKAAPDNPQLLNVKQQTGL